MHFSKPITPLLSCIIILLLGYATGLQLGRMAPYALRIHETYGFSLSVIGWLISLVTLFVAFFAIPASRFIPALGLVRAIKIAGGVMATGAVLFSFAETLPQMIAARVIEAAGHIIAVIASPSYLALKAPEHLRRIFLALWSSFVPVGFALSSFLASIVGEHTGLQTIWFFYAAIMALVMALSFLVPKETLPPKPQVPVQQGKSNISWILVFSFGIYAFLSIGFFTFLPTYFVSSGPQMLSVGVIPLFVPLGSFAAAFLFVRSDGVLPTNVVGLGFLVIGAAALFCFPQDALDGSIPRAVYGFACGITAAAIFTSVPTLTKTPTAASLTIGAIAQAGGSMVLLGGPLAGFVLEKSNWQMLGYTFALFAFSASIIAMMALWRSKV